MMSSFSDPTLKYSTVKCFVTPSFPEIRYTVLLFLFVHILLSQFCLSLETQSMIKVFITIPNVSVHLSVRTPSVNLSIAQLINNQLYQYF